MEFGHGSAGNLNKEIKKIKELKKEEARRKKNKSPPSFSPYLLDLLVKNPRVQE
jgi:malonyl CoA-acyl carrier protein transacylase